MHPNRRSRIRRSDWDRRHDLLSPGPDSSVNPPDPPPFPETGVAAVLALSIFLAVLLAAAFVLSRLP